MYSLRSDSALFARIEGLRRLPPRTSSLPILDPKGGSMKFRSDAGDLLRKSVACISAMIVASAILQSGTASAREREERGNGGLLRAGNGPGPAANGPGPGCNINSRMVAPFAHYDQTSIHGSKFTASTNTRSHRI